MKEEKVNILIHRHLLGTISSEEATILNAWKGESPEHTAFYEKTVLAWQLSQSKVNAFQPNTQKALQKFQDRLEKDSNATPGSVERPIRTLNPRRQLLRFAAVAAALAGIMFVWSQFFQEDAQMMVLKALDGEQKEIQLADGTKIWLNENSTLSYPVEFGKQRKVELQGEAFFDVAKDAKRPFSIKANGANVRVLGTSFNVRSYQNEAKVTVAVRSGKVRFEPHNSSQNWELNANDKLTFDLSRKTYRKLVDETANDWSWYSKQLQFKKTQLKDVLVALERHYRLKIKLSNTDLYECRVYTGTFSNPRVEDILGSLETVFALKMEKTGAQSYLLRGGECK